MESEKTCVMVDFWIVGDKFDIDQVSQQLGLTPTETRRKEDFKIPEFAETEWCISTGYEESQNVMIQFQKIMDLLNEKEIAIKSILTENNLKCGFGIVAKIYDSESPLIEFSRACIQFAAKINAEINFDIYPY